MLVTPLLTIILIITQFIIRDFIGAMFAMLIIGGLGFALHYLLDKYYFEPLKRGIETRFFTPILSTYFPKLSPKEATVPIGLDICLFFKESSLMHKRRVTTYAQFVNQNDEPEFQISSMEVEYGEPDEESYIWSTGFHGTMMTLRQQDPENPFIIYSRDSHPFISEKTKKKWPITSIAHPELKTHFELRVPQDLQGNFQLQSNFAEVLLELNQLYKGKLLLSKNKGFLFLGVNKLHAPVISSFSAIDLKLSQNAHAYFEKASLVLDKFNRLR